MKFEMHVHTAENDIASYLSAKDMIGLYKDAGYDGIVITNHYFKLFFEWFADELQGKSKEEIISRWLLGYREAKKEGQKQDMVVLLGAEVRLDGNNINDYLIYGVDEEFFYNAPYLNELKNVHELYEVLPAQAMIVQAHPFRNGMTVSAPDFLEGIEVYNGGTEQFRNTMAESYAKHYGKLQLSGSDTHCSAHVAKGGIYTEHMIHNSDDLIKVLRDKQYSLLEEKEI